MKGIKIAMAGAGLALAISGAPLAFAASDTDSAFLAAVRSAGMEPVGDGSNAVQNAHITCNNLAHGSTVAAEEDEMYSADGPGSGTPGQGAPLSRAEVNHLVALQIKYYCPSYAS